MMKCPICYKNAVFFKIVIGNVHFPKDKNKYHLFKCKDCEHIFRKNLLNKSIYNENYYSYRASQSAFKSIVFPLFKNQRIPIINLLWKIVQHTTRYQNCPYVSRGNVLDVGGGDGFVLNLYKSLGNNTYNVEIDKQVIKKSKENGHKTFNDIRKIRNIKFDLIRINHVLEHIESPQQMIEECRKRMKKNGLLVIGIPNIRAISFALFGDNFEQLSFPDHRHFFSEASLKIVLKKFRRIRLAYPLHKYGILTNLYTVLVRKYNLPHHPLFDIIAIVFSPIVNIIPKLTKRTHFIDAYCYLL